MTNTPAGIETWTKTPAGTYLYPSGGWRMAKRKVYQ